MAAMMRIALLGINPPQATELAAAAKRMPGVSFAAVIDADAERLLQTAHLINTPIATRLWTDLSRQQRASIDAVVIDGSCEESPIVSTQILNDHKHLLMVCPGTFDPHKMESLFELARQQGIVFCTSSLLRHRPALIAVKESLDSGKLGAPSLLRLNDWQPVAAGAATFAAPKSVDASQGRAARVDPSRGFWISVAANLEVALWIFSAEPTAVYASTAAVASGDSDSEADRRDTGYPSYLQIHLSFARGGMALLTIAHTLPAGDGYQSLTLIGSSGAAYADDHHQAQMVYRGGLPLAARTGEGSAAVTHLLRAFVSRVQRQADEGPLDSHPEFPDGPTVARWLANVRQSLREGQPIPFA